MYDLPHSCTVLYMRVRVLFHDNCFDGAASSALFTVFYQGCIARSASFEYLGLSHGPGNVFAGDVFVEAPGPDLEHACLDFRYSPDERLTWWFDHHQSAFVSPEERTHFEAAHNPRHHYDPVARSCTKFLAQRCQAVYGFDASPHDELIYWADLIDSARFESPQAAVELKESALQLMTWIEAERDPANKIRFIGDLRHLPLAEIVAQPYVQTSLRPLLAQHQRTVEVIRQRARCDGGVVTFDTSDTGVGAANKFIPYYLYPDCHYVVGVSTSPGRCKISVGSNPWYPARRRANIADICSRHGGGGHPVVGAISLGPGQVERARTLARDIAAELRTVAEHEA